jgi:hypothetical protein
MTLWDAQHRKEYEERARPWKFQSEHVGRYLLLVAALLSLGIFVLLFMLVVFDEAKLWQWALVTIIGLGALMSLLVTKAWLNSRPELRLAKVVHGPGMAVPVFVLVNWKKRREMTGNTGERFWTAPYLIVGESVKGRTFPSLPAGEFWEDYQHVNMQMIDGEPVSPDKMYMFVDFQQEETDVLSKQDEADPVKEILDRVYGEKKEPPLGGS